MWRSDYQCIDDVPDSTEKFDPIGMQGQTYGVGMWMPLSAGVCRNASTYGFRSALQAGIVIHMCVDQTYPTEWLKSMMDEFEETRAYCYGDFYPLLSYSLSDDHWAAWQYDRPDLAAGVAVFLRRQNSPFDQIQVSIHNWHG